MLRHQRFSIQIALYFLIFGTSACRALVYRDTPTCSDPPTRLHLSDAPYENYFYSDCHSSSHVVVTSPLPSSNLAVISPRLLIAWPAGNSGIVSFFRPTDGSNGTLSIALQNETTSQTLEPIYVSTGSLPLHPQVGVSGYIYFNSSAVLTIPILGSIRTIRDFTEGPSIIYPSIQKAISFSNGSRGGALLSRTWFDNATTTYLEFTPMNGSAAIEIQRGDNTTLLFGQGMYQFNASFNCPQLEQLSPTEVLNPLSQDLLRENPDQTMSLSFLSYTSKLLAGTWRFLTYFGRDSMISLLLMQPVLSEGQGGAVEAVLSAVLERVNRTDGSVCHEEVIGDYATWLNLQKNISSTAPQCDYKMVDTDFFLPIALTSYLVDSETGRERTAVFMDQTASFLTDNLGLKYADLALVTAEKIMGASAAFAQPGGQTKENLIRLKEGEVVGNWRDSEFGIGGGRVSFDVNTALVPAALRSIAALSRAGVFTSHLDWADTADRYAKIWEDSTLQFFEVTIPNNEAISLIQTYVNQSSFPGPVNTSSIPEEVKFHALALDGTFNQSLVRVMNTDSCFRHFFLNTTNQTQLSSFLEETAEHILQPFPIGLSTSIGLLIANPAYGGASVYASNFTASAYHGTVVWSWQLAMMAQGLARQLDRCNLPSDVPEFCDNGALYDKVLAAYNHLWDIIDANEQQLSSEVWSWRWEDGGYKVVSLGSISTTESDIRQLWSLTFLAVGRRQF